MKRYTIWTAIVTAILIALMAWARSLSWPDIGNNLIASFVTIPITVTLVLWLTDKEKRRLDGLWASEAIFMPLVDTQLLVRDAARWILADDPPGVEADERWGEISKEIARKRQTLGPLITREILLPLVELENALNRADAVTARGEESRKEYAKLLLEIHGRYEGLMRRVLTDDDEVRRDLLERPKELVQLQDKYNWTERGMDRDEEAAIQQALAKAKTR